MASPASPPAPLQKASPPCPSPKGERASPPTPLQRERGVKCFAGEDSSLTASPPCPSPRERGVECSAGEGCFSICFRSLSSNFLIFYYSVLLLFILYYSFLLLLCFIFAEFPFSDCYCLSNILLPSPSERGKGVRLFLSPWRGVGGEAAGVRLLGFDPSFLNSTLFSQVIIFIIYNLKTLNTYLPLHSYTPAGENAFTIHRARAVIL